MSMGEVDVKSSGLVTITAGLAEGGGAELAAERPSEASESDLAGGVEGGLGAVVEFSRTVSRTLPGL